MYFQTIINSFFYQIYIDENQITSISSVSLIKMMYISNAMRIWKSYLTLNDAFLAHNITHNYLSINTIATTYLAVNILRRNND